MYVICKAFPLLLIYVSFINIGETFTTLLEVLLECWSCSVWCSQVKVEHTKVYITFFNEAYDE